MLRQYALCSIDLLIDALADAKLLEFDITNTSLAASIFELIWSCQTKFISDHSMSDRILRIGCQKRILLLCHHFLDRLIDKLEWNRWHNIEFFLRNDCTFLHLSPS